MSDRKMGVTRVLRCPQARLFYFINVRIPVLILPQCYASNEVEKMVLGVYRKQRGGKGGPAAKLLGLFTFLSRMPTEF